jgi:tetratricopeptide (TPR) repeat protein
MRCCKMYKIVWVSVGIAILGITALYFYLNPSYRKSFEARYYYSMGDYAQALQLSRDAFTLNSYNRMASTMMTQSKISLQYLNYIDQAQEYMKQIALIARHKQLSSADKAKMKMMSEVVIGSYKHLSPSVMTNKELVRRATFYFDEFTRLHAKVTASI